jgi:hypothetical protein
MGEIDRISAFGNSVTVFGRSGDRTIWSEVNLVPASEQKAVQSYGLWDGGGRVTCLSRLDSKRLLICLENGQTCIMSGNSISPFINVPPTLGQIVSLCMIPKSSYYVMGSSEGNALLYDLRMQCPVRRMRACNRPAHVTAPDGSGFWLTCGPYMAKFDIHMNNIIRTLTIKGTHVTGCCCVRDWVLTSHSDYSVFGFGRRGLFNLECAGKAVIEPKEGEMNLVVEENYVIPRHEHKIIGLKNCSGLNTPMSWDEGGRLVLWSLPLSDKL